MGVRISRDTGKIWAADGLFQRVRSAAVLENVLAHRLKLSERRRPENWVNACENPSPEGSVTRDKYEIPNRMRSR